MRVLLSIYSCLFILYNFLSVLFYFGIKIQIKFLKFKRFLHLLYFTFYIFISCSWRFILLNSIVYTTIVKFFKNYYSFGLFHSRIFCLTLRSLNKNNLKCKMILWCVKFYRLQFIFYWLMYIILYISLDYVYLKQRFWNETKNASSYWNWYTWFSSVKSEVNYRVDYCLAARQIDCALCLLLHWVDNLIVVKCGFYK